MLICGYMTLQYIYIYENFGVLGALSALQVYSVHSVRCTRCTRCAHCAQSLIAAAMKISIWASIYKWNLSGGK